MIKPINPIGPGDHGFATLAEKAHRAGVATHYHAFWGDEITVSEAVLAKVLSAMGDHAHTSVPAPVVVEQGQPAQVPLRVAAPTQWRLYPDEPGSAPVLNGEGQTASLPGTLDAGYYLLRCEGTEQLVIVAPARCWLPQGLQNGERWWGISTQLYSLRSERNWGIGDFSDLGSLVRIAASRGAAFVGVSPLHALRPERPEQASPYSPSSRLALNVLFIDVTAVPEYYRCDEARRLWAHSDFQHRLRRARESETVLYGDVAALKEPILAALWRLFRDAEWKQGSARGQAFDRFREQHASTLGLHALYESIQSTLSARDPSVWGWPAWPPELQDPQGDAVQAFAQDHADEVAYRYWLQWQAFEQLRAVCGQARGLMPIGVYCDLAVGSSDGGSETWVAPGLYARGMSVGAPPDPLNSRGQDWGLPPVSPGALVAAHLRPWRQLMSTAMQNAGALRIDHAMALMRLFWNSAEGGTYVHYPLDAMMAVLCVESHRQQCMVIGEDLGTVAPQMRESMAQHAVFSYRPLIFERTGSGSFRPPQQWQAQALAVVSTHDLPTLRGFWSAADVAVQQQLGWLDQEGAAVQARVARAQERTLLLAALEAEQLLPDGITPDPQTAPDMTPALASAVHAFLARTTSLLMCAQLEDLVGQVEQANVPGTTEDRHPNWRQRLSVPLEDLANDPYFVSITAAVQRNRKGTPAPALSALPDLATADIPRATYRMQLHGKCTFSEAALAVPYLHALGISHLYTSPYLKAAAGSTHGYDVTDPTRLNPEIGTDADHAALCATLATHHMGHVLDVVPNHMGVTDSGNRWWQEVLEHGEASPHAKTFDIEWRPANPQTGHRVLLPVLGDHYGKVLEAGELSIAFDPDSGKLHVKYFEHSFPLDPRSYALVFAAVPMPSPPGAEHVTAEVGSLVHGFSTLARHDCDEPDARASRMRDSAVYQRRLADLAREHTWVAEWITACATAVNSRGPENGESFAQLDALLQCQAYRLADWRVAGDDINYRRFFDVNGLAAVRMEDPAVFESSHALVMRWLAEGKVSGLRVDHPDGLAQPAQYFERLQHRYAAARAARGHEPRALYVLVEKIMADHEPLPADWPVHGGTGYRFSTVVNGLQVDAGAEQQFDHLYRRFTGDTLDLEEATYECKRLIIETTLFSDMAWLVETLSRITRADRSVCDFTKNRLRMALVEVAAQFPVYRTYVVPGGSPPSETDRRHIAWAVAAARRRLGTAEGGVLAYVERVLLGEPGPAQPLREAFVRRWQQFTAPVTAKAVEDTLFYRYLRLASLNDVGGEPSRFGVSIAAFHHSNLQRSRYFPHQLLATSTHDSKRSEDVRARLSVLSEVPDEWEQLIHRLQTIGHRFETDLDGCPVPQPHDLWNLYQAMVGIWPARAVDEGEKEELVQRLQQYMTKALREAKMETNWLFPNADYEQAVTQYVQKVLGMERFTAELSRFVQRIGPFGARNSLCQVALKLTSPGVPDIYQGCEAWNFSLVDPDNRRPVDLQKLSRTLEKIAPMFAEKYPDAAQWHQWLGDEMPDATKQLVTWRLLQLRRALPDLFRDSVYLPLVVEGACEGHLLAFARIREQQCIVVLCSRLMVHMEAQGWGDTRVQVSDTHPVLGRVGEWTNWMTGEIVAGSATLQADGLLGDIGPGGARLPFAVLVGNGVVP